QSGVYGNLLLFHPFGTNTLAFLKINPINSGEIFLPFVYAQAATGLAQATKNDVINARGAGTRKRAERRGQRCHPPMMR
ncbi:MAG: hypothetical protein ACR2LZ_07850, partial [Pyrinomonadaceae bacterium]